MEFKIGDYVIIIGDYNLSFFDMECRYIKGLYNQIGKIVGIYNNSLLYKIIVISCPYKKECKRCNNTKIPYCTGVCKEAIKSLNSLKLKKFIKHRV